MTTGPFLYDDDPAPLHTGTPRRRNGLLVLVFGGTVVVALLMVGLSYLVKGSPDDQAREVAGVFLAALEKDDVETAYGLMCEDERAATAPDEVADRYLVPGGGPEVVSVAETEVGGTPAREVSVEWDDGTRSGLIVVNEDGPSVCGIAPGP
jgi:hypothetical protein